MSWEGFVVHHNGVRARNWDANYKIRRVEPMKGPNGTVAVSHSPKPTKDKHAKWKEGPGADAKKHEASGQSQKKQNDAKRRYDGKKPDSFLAIQLAQHPTVVDAVRNIQASLTRHNPQLQRVCVVPTKVHLTLGVMRLDTPEKLQKATAVLKGLKTTLKWVAAPLSFNLKGLSTFRNEVIFLEVAEDDRREALTKLATCVQNEFVNEGLMEPEQRPFTPHVTIAKMSKVPPKARKKVLGATKFPTEAYEEHLNVNAGEVQASNVQLCSMDLPPGDSGYYHIHSVFELCNQEVGTVNREPG